MSASAAAIACNRFGLGAAPGELAAAAADPGGWLRRQLYDYQARPAAFSDLPDAADALALLPFYRRRLEQPGMAEAGRRELRRAARRLLQQEQLARLHQAVTSGQSFAERLVHFWSDRLTVSAAKGPVRPLAGLYERETIRPHVMGRFEDLLLASARAPAMLVYLDNHRSVGPGSPRGQRRERGLNENYAREVMELHSLGVDGGYEQADVVELARALTGWTLAAPDADTGTAREGFGFEAAAHEPGARSLLGRHYAQEGEEQGRAMLIDLARHPSTASHLARSLLRHFVADEPPEPAVKRLADRFLESGGDLPSLYDALIESPEAWAEGRHKFKQPEEYLVSLLRALPERNAPDHALLADLGALGQPIWQAPSPAGWPERAEAWISAAAVWGRLEFAQRQTAGPAASLDPRTLLENCLGAAAGEATRFQVANADSREQGLTLLFMSPDFQWR